MHCLDLAALLVVGHEGWTASGGHWNCLLKKDKKGLDFRATWSGVCVLQWRYAMTTKRLARTGCKVIGTAVIAAALLASPASAEAIAAASGGVRSRGPAFSAASSEALAPQPQLIIVERPSPIYDMVPPPGIWWVRSSTPLVSKRRVDGNELTNSATCAGLH